MLNVSKPALARLSRRLTRAGGDQEVALRFTAYKDGWKLTPDQARSGDVTFAHHGRNVLVLDESVSQAMADFTLDMRRNDAGPRLRLHRRVREDR